MMIAKKTTKTFTAMAMSAMFLLSSAASLHAQANMIGTSQVIAQQQLTVDRATLTSMLTEQAVQDKLASMGVSVEQVEQRIASLTAEELSSFNAQLSEAPAGAADAVGILVLFLLIFIVTDILCVTNIFRFVNCAR